MSFEKALKEVYAQIGKSAPTRTPSDNVVVTPFKKVDYSAIFDAQKAAEQISSSYRQNAGRKADHVAQMAAADMAKNAQKISASETAKQYEDKAKQAEQEYETYRGSEEAKKNQGEANKRALEEAARKIFAVPGVSASDIPLTRSDAYKAADYKKEALKAQADHYEAQKTTAQIQATTEQNLKELESWSEEDRNNLDRYITERAGNQNNIFSAPAFDNYNLNPIVEKYGIAKVRQMAETLEWSHSQKLAEDTRKAAENANPVLGNIASVGTNLAGAVTAPIEYAKEMANRTGQYSTLNPNNIGTVPGVYGNAVRQETSAKIKGDGSNMWRNLAAVGYQGGMSILDNLARIAASGGSASVSAAIAASGSFGNGLQKYSAQGADPGQAALMAFADAGLEYVTEKLSDSEMLEFFKGGSKPEKIKKFLWQTFGVEPLSEEVNLFAGIAAEAAILGDKAAMNQQIGDMVANGMSYEEASREAWRQVWEEAKQTYAVSMISGAGQAAVINFAGNVARDMQAKADVRNGVQPQQAAVQPEAEVTAAAPQEPQTQPVSKEQMIANAVAEATGQKPAQIDKPVQNAVVAKNATVENEAPQMQNETAESASVADSGAQSTVQGQNIKGTGAAEANFSGLQQYESLISDDNVQRTRANDARQEEILKKDPYGRTVTEFAGNVGNSEAISDRDVDTLKMMIQDGLLGHDTQKISDVHASAVEKIQKKGAASVRDEITRAVASGKVNEHLIAEAEVLFAQYSNHKGRQDDASTMLLNLAQMATQSGRQLNMFKLMRRLTPEGQLMVVKKNVQRAAERINETRSSRKQVDVQISEELDNAYRQAAADTLSDEAAVESTVAQTIEDGISEDAERAAETALSVIYNSGMPATADSQTGELKNRNTEMVQQGQETGVDIPWGTIYEDGPQRPEPNIQTNDMNERVGQRVADTLTRQAREQNRSVEDVLYSEIMRFANDKAAQGRQTETGNARMPNLEAMRDYYRYRPFFQNAWNIARDRVEQAMFSMQEGDPRIPVIEQFLASGDEMLGVENWSPIGAMDYANPQSTVRRGAKEAANAAGIRMDNRSERNRAQVRQQMRDVLIENAQNKQAAAQRIAAVAVESMGLDGQAAEAMAADVVRAFYNDLAQQSARRVAQMFGSRQNQQRVERTMSQRLAELYNMGAFSNEQYRQAAFDSIFGQNSGIDIDDSLMETFVNAAGERREQAAQEIYKAAAAQIRPTLEEQWDAWRNMAMLFSAKTNIRNFMGSGSFRPYAATKRAIGAALERVLVDQENRTKAIVGLSQNDRALMQWARADGRSDSVRQLMEYSGATGNEARNAIEEYRQYLPGLLETVRRDNIQVMEGTDMFWKQREYAMSMASFLKARGYTAQQVQNNQVPDGVLNEGRQLAIQEAMKATFNDRNRFSNAIANMRVRGANPMARAANAMIKGVLPFTRTPANILVRSIEYSPAGIANALNTATTAVRNGEATMTDAIDQLAGGLTGTGAALLGAALAAGIIPGFRLVGKLDDEEKDAGAKEYSINVGDQYYDIAFLAPANMPLFIGANLYNGWKNREETEEGIDAWDVLSGIMKTTSDVLDPILELSMMSSLNDAIKSMSYQEDPGDKVMSFMVNAATNYLTQGLPTLFGQMEQATETTKKTVFANADNPLEQTFQRVVGSATQKIPGIDLYQKEKVDAEGNVVQNKDNLFERAVNAFFNPVNVYEEKQGIVWDEKQRLNKVLPDSVSSPSIPKTISYKGTDGAEHNQHRLTAEEYSTMEKVQAQTENQILRTVVESGAYAAMTDEQKGKAFHYAQDYAREKARHEALQGYEAPSGWMAGIEGNEADTILRKVTESAITGAMDDYNDGDQNAAAALDEALSVYNSLPTAAKKAMQESGGRIGYYLEAREAGISSKNFLNLYGKYREIDNGDMSASAKANEWANVLEEAKDANTITKAQQQKMQEIMQFRVSSVLEPDKYNTMVESGLDNKKALDVTKLVQAIKGTGSYNPETGKRTVTNADKYTAIANAKYSDREIDLIMKAYMPDYDPTDDSPDRTELKYDTIRDKGYSPEEYAATYKAYQSESKKADKIGAIMDSIGCSKAEATQLYKIYYGSYFK